MKLKEESLDVFTSGDLQETSFSIDEDSQHIIFDILRSKVYKNNIGAICREIASNSRDAQREIGKDDTQIEIEIVDERNSMEYENGLNIVFRDFGVGLSPERVNNIYTRYGASTKRMSNTQTGGFGLGAKTPFSYADAFTVRTVVDNVEYVYSIYIDVSKKGKMALLSQQEFKSDTNITEIIIPLYKNDIDRFKQEVINNTYFWQIQPKLINFENKIYESYKDFYRSYAKSNKTPSLYHSPGKYIVINKCHFISSPVNVIIDGIYYPVDEKLVGFNLGTVNFAICFYYDNGEISISANRETLQYDDDTIENISARYKELVDEYSKKYFDEIRQTNDLHVAQHTYNRYIAEDEMFKLFNKGVDMKYDYVDLLGNQHSRSLLYPYDISKVLYVTHFKGTYGVSNNSGLYDKSVIDRKEEVFWISREEMLKHRGLLSTPRNRTLMSAYPGGVILITESKDKQLYSDTEESYTKKATAHRKFLEEHMGLKISNYWDVKPEKITVKRVKREYLNLRTLRAGQLDREDKRAYSNGYFYHDATDDTTVDKNLIYFYDADKEGPDYSTMQEAMKQISSVLWQTDNNMKIALVSTETMLKRFVNYETVQSYVGKNMKAIMRYYIKSVMTNEFTNLAKLKGHKLVADLEEDFQELMRIAKLDDFRMNEFKRYMVKFHPKISLETDETLEKIKKVRETYPLINKMYADAVQGYIELVNKNNEYKLLLGL